MINTKQIKFFLPLVLLAVFLGGCPYGSKVPIDEPSVKINNALVGKWEPKAMSDNIYTVSKSSDFSYKIVRTSKKSTDVVNYSAYVSDVDGDTFLNIEDESDSDKKYYLYKLVLNSSSTKATLMPVTENIDEVFTTSADLKSFIRKYRNLSFFFEKEEDVYIKED